MTDSYQNQEQDRRIGELEKKMDAVFDHISNTNSELGEIKTDVSWIKRFFWIVASSSIGSLLAALINLLLSKN